MPIVSWELCVILHLENWNIASVPSRPLSWIHTQLPIPSLILFLNWEIAFPSIKVQLLMHSLDPISSCLLKDLSLPFFNVSLPTGSFHQPVNTSPDFTDRQTDRPGLHIPPTSVPSSSELSPVSLSHPNISEKSPTQGFTPFTAFWPHHHHLPSVSSLITDTVFPPFSDPQFSGFTLFFPPF